MCEAVGASRVLFHINFVRLWVKLACLLWSAQLQLL